MELWFIYFSHTSGKFHDRGVAIHKLVVFKHFRHKSCFMMFNQTLDSCYLLYFTFSFFFLYNRFVFFSTSIDILEHSDCADFPLWFHSP